MMRLPAWKSLFPHMTKNIHLHYELLSVLKVGHGPGGGEERIFTMLVTQTEKTRGHYSV